MPDAEPIVILGGGVIGLSLAWELSRRGHRVSVYDVHRFGSKASWAGAGILVPANHHTMTQPLDRLLGYGSELHATWARELSNETGIDNGYRQCGGLYIANTSGEKASLSGLSLHWRQYGIEFEELEPTDAKLRDAGCAFNASTSIVAVPGECQIRNPDHLLALEQACRNKGVLMHDRCGPVRLGIDCGNRPVPWLGDSAIRCSQVCLCAGVWTSQLLMPLELKLPLIPVRGQMLLYRLPQQEFYPIITEGSRYIVPRNDGHVLVGSTMEEAGFDESTTAEGLTDLKRFAERVMPRLEEHRLLKSWAGLRPASHDGFPLIGPMPECDNLYIATGHFKSGLQMSTATAVLLADQMEGREPGMDLTPFAPNRLNAPTR